MHHSARSRRRGIYFESYVLGRLVRLSKVHSCSVSFLVNKACFEFLCRGLPREEVEKLKVEAEVQSLLEEERKLRNQLTVVLRSGAYLRDYAQSLLEGDKAEVSKLKSRKGVYTQVDAKELDVILRILARREAISHRLVELMDKLLPKTRFQAGITENGFKINRKGGEKKKCQTMK